MVSSSFLECSYANLLHLDFCSNPFLVSLITVPYEPENGCFSFTFGTFHNLVFWASLSHVFCLVIFIFLIFGNLSYIDHIFLLPKILQFYSLVKVQPLLIRNSHNLFFFSYSWTVTSFPHLCFIVGWTLQSASATEPLFPEDIRNLGTLSPRPSLNIHCYCGLDGPLNLFGVHLKISILITQDFHSYTQKISPHIWLSTAVWPWRQALLGVLHVSVTATINLLTWGLFAPFLHGHMCSMLGSVLRLSRIVYGCMCLYVPVPAVFT